MNFFDHKDLGNHLVQLCPKVVKHLVYVVEHTDVALVGSGAYSQSCPLLHVSVMKDPPLKPRYTSFAMNSFETHIPLNVTENQMCKVIFVLYNAADTRDSTFQNMID
jgi:hypothetical protein